MGTQFVKIGNRWINPARIAQVSPGPFSSQETRIYYSMLGADYEDFDLPVDEVMRLLMGIGEPDTTNYSEPL